MSRGLLFHRPSLARVPFRCLPWLGGVLSVLGRHFLQVFYDLKHLSMKIAGLYRKERVVVSCYFYVVDVLRRPSSK